MISFRQLLVIALVIGAIWLIGTLRRRLTEKSPTKASTARHSFDDTVRCQHCGVYVIKREAAGNDKDGYSCREVACLASRRKAK